MSSSASITTVIRIPYLKSFRDTSDFLYATTDVALWTTAELGIGISAASLATLRPLLRKLMGESPLAFSSASLGAKKPSGLGYTRSRSRNHLEEYGLEHHAHLTGKSMVSCESGEVDVEKGTGVEGIMPIATVQNKGERVLGYGAGGKEEVTLPAAVYGRN